jgi:hypothetical protein
MGWVVSITPRPHFTPGNGPLGTYWWGAWVGIRAGLDTEARGEILYICRGSIPSRPVCSQTLYWLSYPAPRFVSCEISRAAVSLLIWLQTHIQNSLCLHILLTLHRFAFWGLGGVTVQMVNWWTAWDLRFSWQWGWRCSTFWRHVDL